MKNDMDSKNMTITAQHDRSARPYHHGHALAGILGPAFVAAVAYVDPGNVAANITSARATATCWCGCWYWPTA